MAELGLVLFSQKSEMTCARSPGQAGKGKSRAYFPDHWPIFLAAWGLNTAQPLAKDVAPDSDLDSRAFDLVVLGQSRQISLASIYTHRVVRIHKRRRVSYFQLSGAGFLCKKLYRPVDSCSSSLGTA